MLYLAAMVTNFSMSGWPLGALVAWSCWSPARPAPQELLVQALRCLADQLLPALSHPFS